MIMDLKCVCCGEVIPEMLKLMPMKNATAKYLR